MRIDINPLIDASYGCSSHRGSIHIYYSVFDQEGSSVCFLCLRETTHNCSFFLTIFLHPFTYLSFYLFEISRSLFSLQSIKLGYTEISLSVHTCENSWNYTCLPQLAMSLPSRIIFSTEVPVQENSIHTDNA